MSKFENVSCGMTIEDLSTRQFGNTMMQAVRGKIDEVFWGPEGEGYPEIKVGKKLERETWPTNPR